MTDGVNLGTATLGLEANLAQLRADLDDAKARVAASVAEMQAMLDRLHVGLDGGLLGAGLDSHAGAIGLWSAAQNAELASVRRSIEETDAAYVGMAITADDAADIQVAASGRVVAAYAAQAAAAKAAADAEEAAAGRSALARSILGGIGGHGAIRDVAAVSGIWGVRGPTPPPFSVANPGVVVVEAASRTPLGSLAAAIGEDAQGGGPEAVSVSTERANTRTVIGTTPDTQQARQRAAGPVLLGLDAQRQQVMESSLARALTALEAAQRPSVTDKTATVAGISPDDKKVAEATGSAIADALTADAAAKAAIPSNVAPGQFASAALADLYAAKGLQAALGPDLRMRVYGEGGVPGTHTFGVVPGAVVGDAGGRGGAGGSGGGGGLPSWLTALLWGHAGGGGGGGTRLPGYGGALLAGAGGIGAGFGSLGSFAGFGPEHIILTLGGIAGSGVAAVGGGALLGAGALGKFAVGAGSDAAVGASTLSDTKQLYTAYEAVTKAVRTYGKGSEQAKEATKELDTVFAELGNTAGVKAEAGVAKAAVSLNEFWDKQTSGARVQASKILMQLLELDKSYVPLVAKAAEQNFSVINQNIKPLLAWLKGPEGMGIFLQLENEFRNEIPTAMGALTQGFEFFAKTVAYTAPLTGAFLKDLDRFFTKWNTPSEFAVWEGEMNKLITDFDVWKAFIHELGGALVDLFDKDAHTGETIIETLTAMLHKVREYENSTAGAAAIRNIFTVHKEEVVALLGALVPLISSFTHIYTTVSPPLVAAVTNIAEAFTKVLLTIEKAGPLGTWAIGLTLIAAKLKVLSPLLAALKTELFGVAAAEGEAAAGATALAEGETAAGAGAVAEGGGVAGDAAGLGGLASKSLLLKGGLAGFVGLLGGSALAGAVGAKGTLGTSISTAGAGAGLGFVAAPAADAILGTTVGGPIGAAIGAMIGFGTPYLVRAIGDLFKSGEPAFQKEARRTAAAVTAYPGLLGPGQHPHEATISKALEEAHTIGLHTTENRGTTRAMIAPNRVLEAKDFAKAGTEAGEEFRNAFQHVRLTGNQYLGFLETSKQALEKFPAEVRGTAAKAMLAYATELEAKGGLPKGSVAHILTDLEGQFKEITPFLQRESAGQASVLQKAWRLTSARATLKNSLIGVEQQFGGTWADTTTGAQGALHFLNEIIHSNADPMEKEMAAMLEKGIKQPLRVIWQQAQEVNSRELAKINAEFTSELKTLGVEGVKTLAITQGGGVAKTPFSPIPGEGALAPGHAQGGLLQIGQPGDAGHDTVGLNVGGLPIAVGPGEQVAVFNRHQQPIVNAALEHMGYGGLPGLFGAVTTPNYMAAGGLIPDVVQAGLSDVRKAGKLRMGQLSGVTGHGAVAASGGRSAGTAQMRAWAKAGLEAAGVPATQANIETIVGRMMQESSGNPDAINLTDSNAAAGHPSQGLMQTIPETFAKYHVSGTSSNILDPVANVAAAVRYMLAVYGHLVGAGPGGYALGGLLGFAGGGIVPPGITGHHLQPLSGSGRQVPGSFGYGAKKNPKGAKSPHHYSGPLTLPWNPSENKNLYELGVLLETTLPTAQESYGNLGNQFSLDEYGSGSLAFVVTEGPLGEAITPHEDPSNVQGRLGQLHALFGAESQYRSLLIAAQTNLGGINGWLAEQMAERHKRIKKLQERIKKIRAQIQANLKKLAELEKAREAARTKNKAAIRTLEGQIETAENAAHPNHSHIASLHAQLRVLRGEENASGLDRQIKGLREENKRLSGDETAIGSHGELGPLETSRDTLQSQLNTLGERRSTLGGDLQSIQGVGGQGGTLAESATTLAQLNKQIGELSPESLAIQVARAVQQAGGSAGETPLELAERELAQSEERTKLAKSELLISNQALGVFGGPGDIGRGGINAYAAAGARGMLIPASWIPSFDVGGVVPGARGAPTLAVLHGEEEVLTPEQRERSGSHFHQHNHIETLTPADPDMLLAIGKAATRGMRYQGSRLSSRLVPGV